MEPIDLVRERRLVELLEHALDYPVSEQRAALLVICDDQSLVEETLQLLEDEDDDFLARPAIEEFGRRGILESLTDGQDVRALLRDDAPNPTDHDVANVGLSSKYAGR